jgi:hypothetical protein
MDQGSVRRLRTDPDCLDCWGKEVLSALTDNELLLESNDPVELSGDEPSNITGRPFQLANEGTIFNCVSKGEPPINLLEGLTLLRVPRCSC